MRGSISLKIVYFIADLLHVQIASENDLRVMEHDQAHDEATVVYYVEKIEELEKENRRLKDRLFIATAHYDEAERENKRLRELLIGHLVNPDEGKEPEE